jgi:nitrite reductase/ring-hydroxylating ferredoxin subunit
MSQLVLLDDIPAGRVWTGAQGGRAIFVHRLGDTAVAFVNRCPHIGTPLDLMPRGHMLHPNGKYFVCATHGALFQVEDGLCVAGPCNGQRLTPVAVTVEDGWVLVQSE